MAFTIEMMLKKQEIWAIIRCIFLVKTAHVKAMSMKRMIDHLDFAPLRFLAHFLYTVVNCCTIIVMKFASRLFSLRNSGTVRPGSAGLFTHGG